MFKHLTSQPDKKQQFWKFDKLLVFHTLQPVFLLCFKTYNSARIKLSQGDTGKVLEKIPVEHFKANVEAVQMQMILL